MRQIYYTIQILLRGRGGNFIKLMSLTLGLLIGILLFSQIAYELSYENFYKDPERVALLRCRRVRDGIPDKEYDYSTYRPAAADLWEALPDLVESACLSVNFYQFGFYINDKKLDSVEPIFADTLFFHTMGLDVLCGDPRELGVPQNIFLSQSKARELFGDEEPMGKTLSMDKMVDVIVRGIYQDVPGNTSFRHNLVVSLPTLENFIGRGNWRSNDIYNVFFRLKTPKDVEAMNNRVQKAVERYTETKEGTDILEFSALPLPDIHLSTSDTVRRLVILGVLGFSIFFVSIMNYVLAAVASFGRRAKVVGVHKCCGADGTHVLGMFIVETGLMVMASIVACLLLMYLFREGIEDLLQVRLAELFTWGNLWVPGLTVLLLFLVAGVLPGRMFAAIPVTQIFRRYTDSKRSWKHGLLFVQFIGVAFILGMLITTVWQYHDLMTRNVGFRTERLAVGRYYTEDPQGVEDAIRRQPYVESVARNSNSLIAHYSTTPLTDTQGNFLCPLHYQSMAKGFPQIAGLKLVEGSWPEHIGEALVGRKVVETLKWGDKAIGQRLPVNAQWLGLDSQPTVVGIVEDVRNMGFFMEQTCTAFILSDTHNSTYNVRLKEPLDENLARLNAFVKETYPKAALEFTTYADIQRQNYSEVYRFRNTVWITSLCIFFIVLMGLVGYVNDETQRRSKEIAIRKVNGAEAPSVLRLLSVDILKVAVGAVVIGTGFAWYVSGVWLEQFADSVSPSPVWFLLLALVLLALIVLLVVLKAWRIANENPV
ncbi:ABC transporter permease [uncultured Bacteroides sp.]|uniref:ABC transporter permease n=1 Tax=uncultured Bacteroides sp. TaxID=162156 RepID=UPI0026060886|nr:ABC transporter permease [uncultured Bacteroides sp.]